MILYKIVLCQ